AAHGAAPEDAQAAPRHGGGVTDLAVLCVTSNPPHARHFIEAHMRDAHRLGARYVLALDGTPREPWMPEDVLHVRSAGYIESVLDLAVAACPKGYVLRLDDDELASPEMMWWLAAGDYREHDHWAFPGGTCGRTGAGTSGTRR